jgi:lipopolysaccharide biosynthesis regulator YciM
MQRRANRRSGKLDPGFYQSINYLLNDEQDLAVDALIEQLGIDESTFDTYLALGALVRRRGEVDKAINIHQNLLARPDLTATKRAHAELELANDYLGAGLLGRAEQLLVEMLERVGGARDETSRQAKQQAQVLLVGLYERESDWANALTVVEPLLKLDARYPQLAGHFCCELAEAQLEQAQPDFLEARQALVDGRKFAPDSARVALVSGKFELDVLADSVGDKSTVNKSMVNKSANKSAGKAALKYFERALQLDADLAVDLLPLIQRACRLVDDNKPLAKFSTAVVATLESIAQSGPAAGAGSRSHYRVGAGVGSPVQILLAQVQLVRSTEGDAAAQTLLLSHLGQVTSVKQLSALLASLDAKTLAEALPVGLHQTLVQHLGELAASVQDYRCSNCGFSSSTRHWRCPSCQQWGVGRAVS